MAGRTYALVNWSGPTPSGPYPDLIMLRTRMSTDAPFAGLEMDEEPWTWSDSAMRPRGDRPWTGPADDGRRAPTDRATGRLQRANEAIGAPGRRQGRVLAQDRLNGPRLLSPG